MGWRKTMKAETVNLNSTPMRNMSNIRNIQENDPVKFNIAHIADNAHKVQKLKTKKQQYDSLWKKAWALADWIDDSGSHVPWQDRAARVPELQKMSMMLDKLKMIMNQKG